MLELEFKILNYELTVHFRSLAKPNVADKMMMLS